MDTTPSHGQHGPIPNAARTVRGSIKWDTTTDGDPAGDNLPDEVEVPLPVLADAVWDGCDPGSEPLDAVFDWLSDEYGWPARSCRPAA
jgi:hypothetical protein